MNRLKTKECVKTKPNSKKEWVAITYPQDFSGLGRGLGEQTILRLECMVTAYKDDGYNISHIILACGIGPDRKEYPYQTQPFATMMKEWLVKEGTFSANMIHCSSDDNVWNCIDVTLEIIRMISDLGLPRNILIVSTGLHIYPRMWVTWKILCPKSRGWTLEFIPAWDGKVGILHELAGTIKYIPLSLWYR